MGENIRYLVRDRAGREVGCSLFGSACLCVPHRQAAWKCADRDAFLGWERAGRERNIGLLTPRSSLANNLYDVRRFIICMMSPDSPLNCTANKDSSLWPGGQCGPDIFVLDEAPHDVLISTKSIAPRIGGMNLAPLLRSSTSHSSHGVTGPSGSS